MFQPSSVLLEFLTWFAWLLCFCTIQGKICERYPGIRGVCKKAYWITMALPIAASVFLMLHSDSGSDMFAVLNHAFGAGVFVQTFLRAVVVMKWLMLAGLPHQAAGLSAPEWQGLVAKGDVLAMGGVAAHSIRGWLRGANSRGASSAADALPDGKEPSSGLLSAEAQRR